MVVFAGEVGGRWSRETQIGGFEHDILAFFGPLVFSVFLPHMTFSPFLGPPLLSIDLP